MTDTTIRRRCRRDDRLLLAIERGCFAFYLFSVPVQAYVFYLIVTR